MRIGPFVSVALAAATLVTSGGAALARAKPTEAAFYRVQAVARAAWYQAGAVDAHDCDRDDLKCLNKWTTVEAAAFTRAASVMGSIGKPLIPGKCRTVLLQRANYYARHGANVRKAYAAWADKEYAAAADAYYSTGQRMGQLDGQFSIHCN